MQSNRIEVTVSIKIDVEQMKEFDRWQLDAVFLGLSKVLSAGQPQTIEETPEPTETEETT